MYFCFVQKKIRETYWWKNSFLFVYLCITVHSLGKSWLRLRWNVYCRDRFEDGDSWNSASIPAAAAAAGTERCGRESEPGTADCRSSAYSSVFRRSHDTGLLHFVVLWNRVWSRCLHSGKSVTALKFVDRY